MWGPDTDSPRSSWRVGLCERKAPSLYGGSRRIEQEDFPQKKKTLGGTLRNSPAATAPVSSPSHHPSQDCVHLNSEGAETTGTTWGRVPSDREHAQQLGSVHTHHSPYVHTRKCPHLILEGTETTGTRESVNQGRLSTHTHSLEKDCHKKSR